LNRGTHTSGNNREHCDKSNFVLLGQEVRWMETLARSMADLTTQSHSFFLYCRAQKNAEIMQCHPQCWHDREDTEQSLRTSVADILHERSACREFPQLPSQH